MKIKVIYGVLFLQLTLSGCRAQGVRQATFTRPPENITINFCTVSDVTISCGYQWQRAVSVTWIINGTSFTQQEIVDNPLYQLNNPNTPASVSLTVFSINGTTTFQCIVHSIPNTTSTLGTVIVIVNPMVAVRTVKGGCGYVSATWAMIGITNELCSTIQYNVTLSSATTIVSTPVLTTANFYNFTGLPDDTPFDVTVFGRTVFGLLSNVEVTQTRTTRPVLNVVAAYVNITSNVSATIAVSWQAPSCSVNIIKYSIAVMDQYSPASVTVPANMLSVIISELPDNGTNIVANREYTITASAINDQSRNYSHDPIIINTFILRNCTVTSPSIGTIRVSCVSSHQIYITLTCLYYCTNPMLTVSGKSPLTVTQLDTGTTYFVLINIFDGNQVVLRHLSVMKDITLGSVVVSHIPPENVTVCRGSEVAINCGYQSSRALPVSWIINGILLTQQEVVDSPLYQLNNPTTPMRVSLTVFSINVTTTFQCAVQSTPSISISARGTITVVAAPILLNKANDSTHVTLNKNITITVDITADPDPVATWKLNGGDLGAMTTTSLTVTNDTACAKTYQAVLTVIGFTADHSGIYTVTLENRGGMITEQFERRLEEPAAVTSLTGTGTGKKCIVLGMDSILTCAYSGVPNPSVLWYKITDDARLDIPRSDTKYAVVTHTSTSQTELTIYNVVSEDAGIYGCEVTNSVNGSMTKNLMDVEFVICTKPTFTTPSTNEVRVTDMEDIRLRCKGKGKPEVTYEWFYTNDSGIRVNPVDGEHVLVGVEADTGVHYIDIIKATDDNKGTYICKITTEIGTAESTFTLVVTEPALPPQIYLHPSSLNVIIQNSSTSVTFNCMAYEASSYYWIKEDSIISSTAEGINTNTLLLHNVLPSDSGRYQCVAVNEYGTSYSHYATLTVEVHPPEVIITPAEIKVEKGERAEYVCSATGLGINNFIYQWFLNDLPIADQAMPTLVINDVTEDDTGDYTCFVRNQYEGIGQSGVARLILNQSCPSVTVNYIGFRITWNETLSGVTVEAPCTGDNLNGSVRRRCILDDLWEEFIECFREETRILFDQATNLSLSVNELNVTERISQTSDIATALVNITTPTQEPIYAEDINLAVDIVSTLNNVTESVVTNLTANDIFFEDTASVISNLLSETNRNSWEQLQRTSPSTSQSLVRSSEQVTKLLSATLTNDTSQAIQTRRNIVIKAERIPYDSMDTMYTFPDDNDDLTNYTGGNAQVMLPNGLLQATDSTGLTIASTIITNNSVLRLPSGTAVPQYPNSPILLLQIDPLPADPNALVNNPIMMMFDVVIPNASSEQSGVQDFTLNDLSCNFYDYSLTTVNNLNQRGGWSTEGLSVAKSQSNKMSVTCVTTHLTSFAVLVSTKDEKPPSTAADEALSIVSYIGCAISLVCLCLSIMLLSYTIYKTKDKTNHLFIHLNLCIALALGLVVFITGIENATDNEVACKFVSALLQYLFISAFCWMLCEGVILYMMLITVFGNKLNKLQFFFILGWGPAIPIVAISVGLAHEHYGTDHYCWITSDDWAIAAFIVPIVAIMLVNCVFLAITLKVLFNQRKLISAEARSNKDTVKSLLKAVIILLPLLGFTWIIGILAVNEDTQVFAWIFAILNSLQGVFILVFHVLRNKQVANEVGQRYKVLWNSETIRKLRPGSSSDTTNVLGKSKASESTSSNVSARNAKILSTSFGSGTGDEGYSNTTSKDKTEILEDSVFEKDNLQVITEEKDTGLERKVLVGGKDSFKGNCDVNKEEKNRTKW